MKFKPALALLIPIFMIEAKMEKATASIPDSAGFERTINGKKTKLFVLKNPNGIEVAITNYGARIVSVLAPDRRGQVSDVALGYKTLDGYVIDKMHIGGVIGRFANRIAGGKFNLENKEYKLAQNNGPNCLHGGIHGFDSLVWDAEQKGNQLSLTLTSPSGDEGFPGTMKVRAVYTLTPKNILRLEIDATTDQTTVVNLTNHAYYNLRGEGASDILSHSLMIKSDQILQLDANSIPTGVRLNVKGTPFDFNSMTKIGARIEEAHPQLKVGHGYDHAWILKTKSDAPSVVAELYDADSGRAIEFSTNEPSIQVYTGNFMDGSTTGKGGKPYAYRGGIALEPQHFPDSPNHADFPTTVLKPGEKFKHVSEYRFFTK